MNSTFYKQIKSNTTKNEQKGFDSQKLNVSQSNENLSKREFLL